MHKFIDKNSNKITNYRFVKSLPTILNLIPSHKDNRLVCFSSDHSLILHKKWD